MTLDTYSYLFLKYILVWSRVSRLETTPVENEYFTTERLNINNVYSFETLSNVYFMDVSIISC